MKTYKITNTTNLVGRRDPKHNTVVDIEYIDNRIKKYNKLNAGETMFLTVNTLPLSIHRLRIKNLISVIEISSEELNNIMNKAKPKNKKEKKKPKAVKNPVVLDKNNEFDEKKTSKKSSTKKSSSRGTKKTSSKSSSSRSTSSSKSSSSSSETIE